MDEDKRNAALLREIENRLVWVLAFAGAKAGRSEVPDCAIHADKALKEYQTRFPTLSP